MNSRLSATTLYWQVTAIVLVLEVVSEFVNESVLKYMGFQPGSLQIHLAEFFLVAGLCLPVIFIWIIWRRRWMREMQQRLVESEEDFRSLFGQHPNAVYSQDCSGQFTSVNPAFQKLTGYTLDDLRQLPSFPVVMEQDKPGLMQNFQLALQGMPQQFTTIFVSKMNESIHVDLTYIPIYHNEKISGIYAIAQDITSRKQAEQELWNVQEMFSSLIDNTSDAVFIFQLDRTVLHVNPAFQQIYGWTAEEIVGQPIPPVAPTHLSEEVEEMIRTVLSGQVVSSTETVRQRKDGSLLDVNVTVVPVRNSGGQVVAIAGVSRDITKHKQMARELEQAQYRFQSLVQHAADAISIFDLSGRIIMVNPAWVQLYGWTAQEIVGRTSPFVPMNDGDLFPQVTEHIRLGRVCKREIVRKRKDGREIEVSQTASPIFSADGQVVSIAVIAKDLTELRRTEDMVIRSDKLALAGELAAGIAHEIRNPLTAIQGFLQLMQSKYDPNYVSILLHEVKRIQELTDELLLLSRPQIELRDLADITEILHDVLNLMESEANLYNVSIQIQSTPNLPPIYCGRNQIKQVFTNLIKNSIEAMPHGGNIQIEIGQSPLGITVTVADNGPGIPPGRLHKLGEPFYTTKDRGTGLGLMVAYRIIQKHEGTIQVSSELGKGTIFSILLPAVRQSIPTP